MKTTIKLLFTFLLITVISSCSKDDPATIPDPPIIGTATFVGRAEVTIAFTAPSNDGGSTILMYTATSTPDNITGTLEQAENGSITITGLTANTEYTFTVTATNAIGTSIDSSASNSIRIPDWFYNCYSVYDAWGYYLYDDCYWEYY